MTTWPGLVKLLDFSLSNNVPLELVLHNPGSGYVSLFDIARGIKTKNGLIATYNGIKQTKTLANGFVTPREFAMAWVVSTSPGNMEVNARYYLLARNDVNSFLGRYGAEEVGSDSFPALVKMYASSMANGLTAEQANGLKRELASVNAGIRFAKGNEPYEGERFILNLDNQRVVMVVGAESVFSLFDSLEAGTNIPFASLNVKDRNRLFKVYDNRDSTVVFTPPTIWVQETGQSPMRAKLFLREEVKRENYNSKAAYSDLVYDGRELWFWHSPQNSVPVEEAVSRVRHSLHTPILSEAAVDITASFIVRGIIIEEYVIADVLMQDQELREFVYADETSNPASVKERNAYHVAVGTMLDMAFSFSTITATQNSVVKLEDSTSVRLEKGEQYTVVTMKNCPNLSYAEWLRDIVLRIIRLYEARYDSVVAYYNDFHKVDAVDIHKVFTGPTQTYKKLDILQLVDPNLFIPSYGSKVQSSSQPMHIKQSEVQSYLDKGVQVIRYPAHITNSKRQVDPVLMKNYNYYVSPSASKPYIGLPENNLENCNQHPYLLSTYTQKVLEVDPVTWDITILLHKNGRKEGSAKSYILDVNKILRPDRKGMLRTRMSLLLDDHNDKYKRLGMPESTSSLIHSVYYALNSRYATEEEVRVLRREMGETVLPEVARQERYDQSLPFIRKQVLDDAHTLDTWMDARYVEEFFNVSVYTFAIDGNEPHLEVPRHKDFYTRVYPSDRPIVILYKHIVSEHRGCVTLTTPVHYELVVLPSKSNKRVAGLFKSDELRDKLESLMRFVSHSTVTTVEDFPSTVVATFDMNVAPVVKAGAVGQVINGKGKVERLLYPGGTEFVVPLANYPPLNVPSESDKPRGREIPKRRIAQVIKTVIRILYTLSGESKLLFAERVVVRNTVYDISGVSVELPFFDSFAEAVSYFHGVFPSLVTAKGLLLAESPELKEGMDTLVRSTFLISPPLVIRDFYLTPGDYASHNVYELILDGEPSTYSFVAYAQARRETNSSRHLHHSVEPYVVINNTNLFVVQDVLLGEKERALTVAETWNKFHINPGYYTHVDLGTNEAPVPEFLQYNDNTHLTKTTLVKVDNRWMAMLALV